MKFTGQERDLNLTNQTTDDLDYMHARYYAFNIGRFMSVDPVRGNVGSSQSWNAYMYVRDNPILLTDPTGKKARVLNERAYHLLEEALGADAKLLTMDKAGKLSLKATAAQLAHNEALKVLSDIINAKEMYGITVSSVVRTKNGLVRLGPPRHSAVNLTARRDPTYSKAVNDLYAPPAGFDALVAVEPNIERDYVGVRGNKGKPVLAAASLFHETAEAYGRTTEGMPRNIAHARAIGRELRWRKQFPLLERYSLGAGPIAPKR